MRDRKQAFAQSSLWTDSMCAILGWPSIQCVWVHFWFEIHHTDRVCRLLYLDAWIHSRELCTLGERIFWLNGPCWRRNTGKAHSWNATEHVTRLAGPSHVVLQEKATTEELCGVAVREDTSLPHSTAIFILCSWETMAHACLTCHGRR